MPRRRTGVVAFVGTVRRSIALALSAAALVVAGCHYFPDHYLGHPDRLPGGAIEWTENVAMDGLLVHVRAARPPGSGPFPAVIVLPEGGGDRCQPVGIGRERGFGLCEDMG